MNIVQKFKIRKVQKGAKNNWFRNTADKISNAFWDFGDATGMYDQESVNHMFSDLQHLGILPKGGDNTSYGIVAPGILNVEGKAITIPRGMSGETLSDVITASKANPAFNEAERVAQLDFQKQFGSGMPLATRRGRPALKDAFGNDVKYPKKITVESEPVTRQPTILKEGVTGNRIQRQKGLSTSVENKAKASKKISVEAKEDKAMHLTKKVKKKHKLDESWATNDLRHYLSGQSKITNEQRKLARIQALNNPATRSEASKLFLRQAKNKAKGKTSNQLNQQVNNFLEDYIIKFGLYKKGGRIHIKEKNKGKFTEYCGGKVTNECIKRAKASGNPTLIKRATFADNARHFKHKTGGKAFVSGVNVLDSNPNAYKYVKKRYRMHQTGGTIKAGLKAKRNLTKRKAPDWDTLDRGYRYLTQDMKLPHDQTIALMGNVVEESQGNHRAVQRNGGGKGLIQWDGQLAPSGLYGQWGKIWASVSKPANVYDSKTDTMKNYWAPWQGLKGDQVRKKFISAPLKQKTKIYAESYLRPGKPRIADRQLSAMQLDSIYNPKIKNKLVTQ